MFLQIFKTNFVSDEDDDDDDGLTVFVRCFVQQFL